MAVSDDDMELVSVASDEGLTPSASSFETKKEQVSLHRYGRCTFTTTQGSVVETTGPRASSSSSEKPWACQFGGERFSKVQGLRGHESGKHTVLLRELRKQAASAMPLSFLDCDGGLVVPDMPAEEAQEAQEAEEDVAVPAEEFRRLWRLAV